MSLYFSSTKFVLSFQVGHVSRVPLAQRRQDQRRRLSGKHFIKTFTENIPTFYIAISI
jgi:hypothetical protein